MITRLNEEREMDAFKMIELADFLALKASRSDAIWRFYINLMWKKNPSMTRIKAKVGEDTFVELWR